MTNEILKILVVDDHPMIRRGLAAMIEAESDFTCVGEADGGDEAVRLACERQADVVLMDLAMPKMNGIEATRLLKQRQPQTRVLMLSSMVEPSDVQSAIQAGASGFLSKTASSQELVTAIRMVHSGRRMLSADATDALIRGQQANHPGSDLTPRERDVLQAMSLGMSNQDIAAQLVIAVPTIKFHITNILSKLQVDNRTEAVLLAIRHGLVAGP